MLKKIAIIDHGFGNIQSVVNACNFCGCLPIVINDPKKLLDFNGAILPGVGAFGPAIEFLRRTGFDQAIKNYVNAQKMLYGTCLGFQLLFSISFENGQYEGLNLIEGTVEKFNFKDKTLKVPHMGWNNVNILENPFGKKMYRDIKDGENFYFVHSYYANPKDKSLISSVTDYGIKFCSAIASKNIWGSQFHPEKSGTAGLKLMKNFIEACK
ncbi:MAG: imidazole glycerol phosphate synthase subunit HisH [Elusimicrobiota bacterium]|jgi:glutamine amidotransferase|nr:imidazole glycerol phosphate synthase subunit HisH [Elusimicrobiota bacterium]